MTKTDLILKISKKFKVTKSKAEIIVSTIFEALESALEQDDRIEIRGFGSFVNREYEARTGRNPKTGESIRIPSKKRPHFKIGKELHKLLNP